MAGNYPDPPGRRMAYDRDGTVLLWAYDNNTVFEFTTGDKQTLNGEAGAFFRNGWNNASGYLTWVFPELRSLVGYWAHWRADNTPGTGELRISTNTATGVDGTWSTAQATWTRQTSYSKTGQRTNITAVSGVSAVRAIGFRFSNTNGNSSRSEGWHLYGEPATGENPDRLRFWHPTLDQEVSGAYLEWGDTPRLSTETRTFRIKNNSASLTAYSIVVAPEALTDGSPSIACMYMFSINAAPFDSPITITSLGPGAISPVISVRRTWTATTPLSLWWQRITAIAGSWT